MNVSSIRVRLTAWYALVLAVTFAAAGATAWLTLRQSIHDTVDRDLELRLVRMQEFLDHLDGGTAKIAAELAEDAALAPSGTQFRLYDSNAKVIYESPDARNWNWPRVTTGPRRETATLSVEGKPVRILSASIPAGFIEIGLPLDAFYSMLHTFTWLLLVASPLLLLIACGSGYWISRRALEPVDLIAARAQQISAQSLSHRLPLRGSGDELDRLSETLNEMLARLESAFRKITQFTADASHELRTPVAIVQATAEVTTARPRSPEEHVRAWKLVLAESQRTAALIDDLLTLARSDCGTGAFLLEPMDLADCVRSACHDVAVLFAPAGLSLRFDLPDSCPFTGDAEALRRLCLILLDNALKYTPAGGNVDVSLRQCRDGQPLSTILEVQDNGIGIAAQDQRYVFDRFYRVSRDRSRKTGGAGLGLAIAQLIVVQHRGNLTVDSAPGSGSTFRATLPLD